LNLIIILGIEVSSVPNYYPIKYPFRNELKCCKWGRNENFRKPRALRCEVARGQPSCQDKKMFEEKRKFKRFKAKEGAFAAFIEPDELINMGQVQNVSMGGLCMRYLSTNVGNGERAAIKIFGNNERFIHLDKVPCRVVYDCEVPEGSWEQISTKCCGVEFTTLSVKHQSLLQEFIDCFAFGEPEG